MDVATSSASGNAVGERPPRVWPSLVCALAALVFSVNAAFHSWPPEPNPHAPWAWLLGVAGVVLVLRASALPAAGPRRRVALAVCLFLSLAALWNEIQGEYYTFSEYPWPVLFLGLPALLTAAWRCRQRWLVVAVLAFFDLWFQGATQGPDAEPVPRTRMSGDLTVTFASLGAPGRGRGAGFHVASRSGADLWERYLLNGTRVVGRVGPHLPFRSWGALPIPREWQESPSQTDLHARVFAPDWAPSLEFSLVIPTWPRRPALALTVPVPAPGKAHQPAAVATNALRVELLELRRGSSEGRSPPVPCLHVRLRGFPRSAAGGGQPTVRFRDGKGRPVEYSAHIFEGELDRWTEEGEIYPIPEDLRTLRLEVYTAAQMAAGERVFRFGRVPNRAFGSP